MKEFNEFELTSPGKPLVIISVVSWVLFVIGTFIVNFLMFVLQSNELYAVSMSDLLMIVLVYSLIALFVFSFGIIFGILIQKKNKIGLYGYTIYMIARLYIVYYMFVEKGNILVGGVGIVLYLFELGVILKLWFTKSGKAWFAKKTVNEE